MGILSVHVPIQSIKKPSKNAPLEIKPSLWVNTISLQKKGIVFVSLNLWAIFFHPTQSHIWIIISFSMWFDAGVNKQYKHIWIAAVHPSVGVASRLSYVQIYQLMLPAHKKKNNQNLVFKKRESGHNYLLNAMCNHDPAENGTFMSLYIGCSAFIKTVREMLTHLCGFYLWEKEKEDSYNYIAVFMAGHFYCIGTNVDNAFTICVWKVHVWGYGIVSTTK